MNAEATLLLFLLLHLLAGAVLPEGGGAPLFHRLALAAARRTRQGLAAVILFAAAAVAAGWLVSVLSRYPNGWLAWLAGLFLTVSFMGPVKTIRAKSASLAKKDEKAQHARARASLTEGAIELCAEGVAPVFWFLVLGAPGMFLSAALFTLRRAAGNEEGRGFARLADRVFNFLPAILTAFLIALAALFVSRSSPFRTLGLMSRHEIARRHLAVAAMAGALGVTLGGPPFGDWVGPENTTAKITVADMQRAALIHFVAFLCVIVLASLKILAAQGYS